MLLLLLEAMLSSSNVRLEDYNSKDRIEEEQMCDQGQMIKYINVARQFPAYYVNLIDKQLGTFINDREIPINQDMIYQTNQGKKAWREARAFLVKQGTLPPLEAHEGLCLSAKDHAIDLVANNLFGHTGSDKSTFSERILRHCKKGQGCMAEIIGADFYLEDRNNAEMTIMALIVDDGVVDRGHRKTIFNPQYRYIGCKSEVQNQRVITVFDLTQNKLHLRSQASTKAKSGASRSRVKDEKMDKVQGSGNHDVFRPQIPSMSQKQESKIRSSEKSIFKELSSNVPSSNIEKGLSQMRSDLSGFKDGKKISEKKEDTRILFEDGAKITETHSKIFYEDGTREENIQRHTVFS